MEKTEDTLGEAVVVLNCQCSRKMTTISAFFTLDIDIDIDIVLSVPNTWSVFDCNWKHWSQSKQSQEQRKATYLQLGKC